MIDITRTLHAGHPTWPGDTPYALESTAAIAAGSSVNVMKLTTSTHLGTHVDAPYHYRDGDARLEGVPLERLVGEALVLRVPAGEAVGAGVLATLDDLPPRVLLCSGEPNRWQRFPEAFTPLTPELVHALADRGVRLLGTDAPSVDTLTSRDLPVHHACGERDVTIVEGLALADVAEGRYRLVCLPLSLPHADAAPARAVLEPLS